MNFLKIGQLFKMLFAFTIATKSSIINISYFSYNSITLTLISRERGFRVNYQNLHIFDWFSLMRVFFVCCCCCCSGLVCTVELSNRTILLLLFLIFYLITDFFQFTSCFLFQSFFLSFFLCFFLSLCFCLSLLDYFFL